MVTLEHMTESEIQETIDMSVNSEQERKLLKEAFKLLLGKEERLEIENRKVESEIEEERLEIENRKVEFKIEEEEEVMIDENYMNFGSSSMMLIAKGIKKSVVSREWIREYFEVLMIDEIKEKRSDRVSQ